MYAKPRIILFVTVKSWKQCKYPAVGEWLNEYIDIQLIIYNFIKGFMKNFNYVETCLQNVKRNKAGYTTERPYLNYVKYISAGRSLDSNI